MEVQVSYDNWFTGLSIATIETKKRLVDLT